MTSIGPPRAASRRRADSPGMDQPCYKCGARHAGAVPLRRHRLWICQRCYGEALWYDGPAVELAAA